MSGKFAKPLLLPFLCLCSKNCRIGQLLEGRDEIGSLRRHFLLFFPPNIAVTRPEFPSRFFSLFSAHVMNFEFLLLFPLWLFTPCRNPITSSEIVNLSIRNPERWSPPFLLCSLNGSNYKNHFIQRLKGPRGSSEFKHNCSPFQRIFLFQAAVGFAVISSDEQTFEQLFLAGCCLFLASFSPKVASCHRKIRHFRVKGGC